jgi:hypothetical protein
MMCWPVHGQMRLALYTGDLWLHARTCGPGAAGRDSSITISYTSRLSSGSIARLPVYLRTVKAKLLDWSMPCLVCNPIPC